MTPRSCGCMPPILLGLALLQSTLASFLTSAFHVPVGRSSARIPYRVVRCKGNSENEYDDDHGDEIAIQPYRNRSLTWTLNYRKVNPYEKARTRVLGFGHRSKDDWDEAVSSGQLGQCVPSYPDEMYAPEWVGWEEWLGLMRSYGDTKNLATNVLGLKSLDEYLLFVKSNAKRAEGLRIPVRPDIYYKDEWIDEETFFGKK